MIEVRTPVNTEEWEGYFNLRWQVLRAPWHKPRGSEQDLDEFHENTFHAMAVENRTKIVGVARLHLLPEHRAQIRYMAVLEGMQGKGIGSELIGYLEKTAKLKKVQTIILQARANAVNFYSKHQFKVVEKTFLMYDEIQHYLMEKHI